MNKQELVAAVAKQLGLTKAKANEIAELFFAPTGVIASELQPGRKSSHQRVWKLRGSQAGRARMARPAHRQGRQHQGVNGAGVPGQPGTAGSGEQESGRRALRVAAATAVPLACLPGVVRTESAPDPRGR